MSPPADSIVTSDQNGLITIQMPQKNARYRLRSQSDGSMSLTPEPAAQEAAAGSGTLASAASARSSARLVESSQPTLEMAKNEMAKKPQESVRGAPVAPDPVPTLSDAATSSTSSRSAASSNSPAQATSSSSSSDGWLQLNREAMRLLRARSST